MKKFIFVYHGGVRAEDIKPEDMKATMDRWMAWFGSFKDKMVDGGSPFSPVAMSVTAKDAQTISEDLWPAKGYTIINAVDMDEAVEIAKTCPVTTEGKGGSVRVYESMPM